MPGFKMRIRNPNLSIWVAGAVTAVCWAYSAASRYTDFMAASRADKTSYLLSLLILSVLLSVWVFWILMPKIKSS